MRYTKFLLGVCTVGCTAIGPVDVTDSPPVVQIGVNYDTGDSTQSETTIVRSVVGLLPPIPILVTGFNDFSWSNVGTPEFDHVAMVVHRGASLMGWSTSGDIGTTWNYRGKVYPTVSTSGGLSWSWMGGDPSMAVDPNSPNVVYYANLAATTSNWDAVNGASDTIPFAMFGQLMNNGICVAQSMDGGQTFGSPSCVQLDSSVTPGTETTDRTSITVDGSGRVYVATRDTSNEDVGIETIRVFRTTTPGDITTFAEASPPMTGDFDPRLRTDTDGNVWLGSLLSGTGVFLAGFDISHVPPAWLVSINITAQCAGLPVQTFDLQPPIGGTSLRSNHDYDFDVGLDPFESPTFGFVFQLTRSDGTKYLQAAKVAGNGTFDCDCGDEPLDCSAPGPNFSTFETSGDQIQPSINYRLREVTSTGAPDPEWWMVYYTSQYSPDPTNAFVEVEGEELMMAGTVALPLRLDFPTLLTPTSWFACPDTTANNYWGDYFDLTQVRDFEGNWWSVSAFESSAPAPPCTSPDGLPQHIDASRW
jgi:hypothetical protein